MLVSEGKIARVNLSTGKISYEERSKYPGCLGGRGINQRILFNDMPVGTSPFDPQIPLAIGAGLLCGTGAPGASRVSIDTKKKELIGDFKNAGRKWSLAAEEVNAHDFRQDAEYRAVPYGIYDTARNEGHVCVGTSAETGRFCVDALRHWWRAPRGSNVYPKADAIFIEADAGGGNSPRRRLWKRELQRLADDTGLELHHQTPAVILQSCFWTAA